MTSSLSVLFAVVLLALAGCREGHGRAMNAVSDGGARTADAGRMVDAGPPAVEPEPEDAGPDDAAVAEDAGPQALASCELDTGWAGDDSCIVAPDPELGMQFRFGPADYDDPDEVAKFVLEPGQERLSCAYIVAPNDQEIYYSDWLNRFRPGSHHMIVTMAGGEITEGAPLPCGQGGFSDQGLVGGNTTSVAPFPEIAPENEGLARTIRAHSGIVMQLHFFNIGDEPLLMEAWQNIYFMPREEVRGFSAPIEGIAGLRMRVQPGTTQVIAGSMAAPIDLRVIDLFSHNHSHTNRFSAYLRRQDAERRILVYESYDWSEPLYLPLDSIHETTRADRYNRTAGGHTGLLELKAGDRLEWECEIENDDLDIPLRFANEAMTAEMCILRGDYAPSTGSAWSAAAP